MLDSVSLLIRRRFVDGASSPSSEEDDEEGYSTRPILSDDVKVPEARDACRVR